ncbi:MAG: Response regulator rcp1 [bacterium ADurb.Bin429]|nr:MAG: Response regulator rcp1 [bacterium ADurb.Bin429]
MSTPIILLVEDNRDDEELTRLALKECNVANELVVARDGKEALDWLFCEGQYADRDPCRIPCIILLDLKLPKISGLEVLERLRATPRTRRLPVVILTSSREEQDLLRGYDLGANSYIRKPVDFDQFTNAVRQLGVYWMVLNELPPKDTPCAHDA